MTRRVLALLSFTLVAVAPGVSLAAGPVHRFALVVGANYGGPDRPRLQYAVSDAERFARVMVELGGVTSGNEILLKQPKLRDLMSALDLLGTRANDAKRAEAGNGGGRTEIVLYYSGHADEKGLLLGEDRYSYRSLRDRLDQVPADVRIVVLDACASGAFTRIKGGKARPAFLVDESSEMRGHAFLTSSAATEAAQESDRIRASYFTHYLVSGLRGAADLSADGRVTLNEAYQFAFNETLGGTLDTKGGAQHPSYDINMSGTGDVVMTDVRQTSATLVLGEDLDGRFFIRNAAHDLVIELYKPYGRKVELALEPGAYEIRVTRQRTSLLARAQVAEGGRVVLEPRQFNATSLEATRARGDFSPRFALAGRNRLAMRIGVWNTDFKYARPTNPYSQLVVPASAVNLLTGGQFTRYATDRVSFSVAVERLSVHSSATMGEDATFAGHVALFSVPVGVRWNPLKGDSGLGAVQPFVQASVGPVVGSSRGVLLPFQMMAVFETRRRVTAAGLIGGGVDVVVSRGFAVGVDGGYNWIADFHDYIGSKKNYNGFNVAVSAGWLFGSGRSGRN